LLTNLITRAFLTCGARNLFPACKDNWERSYANILSLEFWGEESGLGKDEMVVNKGNTKSNS